MWLSLPIVGLLFYLLEFARPVASRPRMRSWVWRVWGLNVLQIPVALGTALIWHRLADGTSLLHLSRSVNPWAAGAVGYLVYTFVFYWWHRVRHASDLVWRTLHQIHHSPSRLELVTAFYKHPLETLCNALIAAGLMFGILGLDLRGAVVTTILAGLADLFYHANVRTPDWIAWLVQRPEMHRLHHECGRHEGNYGDLPLWDWLFGTLRLPSTAAIACGFDAGLEEQLLPMLRFADVHAKSQHGLEEIDGDSGQ
jgi:sterol desaturase/sphingolipid hydroxylase (fatty acid hydroxylase superfamily)